DMKPNNMVIPLHDDDPEYGNIFLIDLGLSRRWCDDTGVHIPWRVKNKYSGTLYYIGTHAHSEEASRRDDLQALAIIALDCLIGDLPWKKHEHAFRLARRSRKSSASSVRKLKSHRDKAVCQEKKNFIHVLHHNKQIQHLPIEFRDFMLYTHNLAFTEEPAYEVWIQKFIALIDRKKWINHPVDWAKWLRPVQKEKDSHHDCSVSRSSRSSRNDSRKSQSSSGRRKTPTARPIPFVPTSTMFGLRDFQSPYWIQRLCSNQCE